MFGSDRFAFETPNVIDPGDLPPSQPERKAAEIQSPTGSAMSGASSEEEDDYHKARASSARLLRDINDLDLTPAYDPYDDEVGAGDDDDDDEDDRYHSLPSVEQARTYAASLLRDKSHPFNSSSSALGRIEEQPLHLDRTVQLSNPNRRRRYVRQKLQSVGLRWCLLASAVTFFALLVGITVNQRAKDIDKDLPPEPRTSRREGIINFIASQGVSSVHDLSTLGRAPYWAAEWMSDIDSLQYDIDNPRFVQRYALAVFFFATNGNAWKNSFNFVSDNDECAWNEREPVQYADQVMSFGATCDRNLQVETIFMPKNGLKGTLPSELGHLPQLQMIGLASNALNGSIPEGWKDLVSVIYLDLKNNALTGTLPDFIGDFENLEVLGLSNNHMRGSLPDSLGTVGRLKTLALDNNIFSGNVAKFANHLIHLEYFYADNNLFTGKIDDTFLADCVELRDLDLSTNQLTSTSNATFTSHLFEFSSLQTLDLSNNKLGGELPKSLSINLIMSFLSLRGNVFRGSLGTAGFPRFDELTHLDLHDNQLTGSIPHTLSDLSDTLTYLFLGENNFTAGEIPAFMYDLKILRELSLTATQRTGAIPPWMDALTHLKLIDLSHNKLAGDVSRALFDLPNMTYLLLDHNQFTGKLPYDMAGAPSFKTLSLHKNQFVGDVSHFCVEAEDLDLLAVDCALTCDKICCPTCCKEEDEKCYDVALHDYLSYYEDLWEFNSTRPLYSFDPAILAESNMATIPSP